MSLTEVAIGIIKTESCGCRYYLEKTIWMLNISNKQIVDERGSARL